MMNKYGLKVSLWMIPQLISMGVIVVKCAPRKEMIDFVCEFGVF